MTTETKFDLQEEIESIAEGFRSDFEETTQIKSLLEKAAATSTATENELVAVLRGCAAYAGICKFSVGDVLDQAVILFNYGVKLYYAQVTISEIVRKIAYVGCGYYSGFPVAVVDSSGNVLPLRDIMSSLVAKYGHLSDNERVTVAGNIFRRELCPQTYLLLSYPKPFDPTAKSAQMSLAEMQAIEKKIREATILYLETVAGLIKDCNKNDCIRGILMCADDSRGLSVGFGYEDCITDNFKREIAECIKYSKTRLTEYE